MQTTLFVDTIYKKTKLLQDKVFREVENQGHTVRAPRLAKKIAKITQKVLQSTIHIAAGGDQIASTKST